MSVPNLITLARLLSVPLIIWLVLANAFLSALVVFALAGLSDAVDGFIAKRWDQRSALGAKLLCGASEEETTSVESSMACDQV